MRAVLKGVHTVRRRLATGAIETYYYAWRGGPRIFAQPHTAQFVSEYAEAHQKVKLTGSSVLRSLITDFKSSAEFLKLASSSRVAYFSYFKLIELEFGDMPLDALIDPRARGEFKRWRDSMSSTPRKADYAWTTLARILAFAKDRGRISMNPCERGGRIYRADRTEKIWTEEQVSRIVELASSEMTLAIRLALGTAQRQGDLLRLRWSDYDGTYLRLTQSKTRRAVTIKVVEELRALLDATPRRGPFILTNSKAMPWTPDGFRTSWRKLCTRANIQGLTFHDLRGTAITALAKVGATPQEIASLSGHSISDVSAILDRHYLGDRVGLAESAIEKLEKENRTKTVKRL